MIQFYRLLSYLLLPVAILFSFFALAMLVMALGNLAALLPLFLVAATVIYIITSFMFMQRGVLGGQPLKHSLRDWVKVNAYVALFFAISSLSQTVAFLGNPQLLEQVLDQAKGMVATMQQANPGVKMPDMATVMKGVLWLMAIISTVLLAHIFMGLTLLRRYANLFV
jgi:hypothetical protein